MTNAQNTETAAHYLGIVPGGWAREETIEEAAIEAAKHAPYIENNQPTPFVVWACGPESFVDAMGRIRGGEGDPGCRLIKEGKIVRQNNTEYWDTDWDDDRHFPMYIYRILAISDPSE